MVGGVMRLVMPHLIVHHDGFAMHRGNRVARLNRLHARLQIGQLLMLLCCGGHQLGGRHFSGGFQLLQGAVEQGRI